MPPSRYVDDFDDDGLDDDYEYDDAEGMTAEDEASMAEGTAAVRQELGVEDSKKVTLQQIQDALWDFYYDVPKSVSYLKKTFLAPPPQAKPPPKPAPQKSPAPAKSSEGTYLDNFFSPMHSFSVEAAGADPECPATAEVRLATGLPFALPQDKYHGGGFFDDMPWMNTPQDRQTIFIEPFRPRGGLLGGGDGSGMSKLQKLAAARKKKADDAKQQEKTSQIEKDVAHMSVSDPPHEAETKPVPVAKRQKLSSETPQPESNQTQVNLSASKPTQSSPAHDTKQPTAGLPNGDVLPQPKPSAFARILCGPVRRSRSREDDVFPMPYTQSPLFSASNFSQPSPDDIVFEAQSKAGKSAPKSKSTKKTNDKPTSAKADAAAEDISSLTITDAPPPKSKGLDVVKEFESTPSKRSLSFVVVGHVDAGKSTLMGRLLTELKFVDQRTVDKYKRQSEKVGKQSFALAWVMDQRSEERDRGVTIDIATNYFETDQTRFTILDAPGHQDFVPNMIAGASQADFAILVIDANTGAYEKGLKGQTREHVLLLRSLGVQRIVVAVNKLDMVNWSQERFDEINGQITGFLSGLGFQEKHINFIPMSGLNGDNIVKPIENTSASWYKGTTLIDALEGAEPSTARALRKPLRMAISEVFRSEQGTTTLSGRIDAGTMQVGDVLVVQPSGENSYVKSIVTDNDKKDWAVAGQHINLALTNIDPIHIKVGDILCHPTDAIACGDTFTMKAMAFDHLMPTPVDLHRGRLHAPGQIKSIVATLDKATGEIVKKKPKVIQPGEVARVKVKLQSKVPLEAGQRVVIRTNGETIAAGLLES